MKPGLTGLAQVSGCRGPVLTGDALEKRLAHDLDYVDNWSLWLDLKILLRTLAQPLAALGRAVGRRLPARKTYLLGASCPGRARERAGPAHGCADHPGLGPREG
jgi:hypothetical protein